MPSQSTLTTFLLASGLAAAIVILVIPLVRVLARWLGAVAQPKADRWNRRTIPLLGGLGIWAATLISAFALAGLNRDELLAIGAASSLMFVGLFDDLKGMRPSTKLTAQIAVACVLVVLGVSLDWTGSQPLNAITISGSPARPTRSTCSTTWTDSAPVLRRSAAVALFWRWVVIMVVLLWPRCGRVGWLSGLQLQSAPLHGDCGSLSWVHEDVLATLVERSSARLASALPCRWCAAIPIFALRS